MKRISLLIVNILLITSGVFSQKNLEDIDFDDLTNKKLVSEFIWSDFKSAQDYPMVPEEFKDDAAVYLEKEFYYSFKAKRGYDSNVMKVRKLYRWIIKIQQNQGIEDFSTLKFVYVSKSKEKSISSQII